MTDFEVRANELLKKVLRVKDRAQREEVLERECADEPLLRVLVEALLKQGEEAAADAGGSQSAVSQGAAQGAAVKAEAGSDEKVGGLLGGKYRLAEMIGEGGMGSV